MTGLKPALAVLGRGERLSESQAESAFSAILTGDADPLQIAGLLMALRARGETVAELAGALRAMRTHMRVVQAPDDAIDVCGTGGDGYHTLNVSTAVAFVVAGAGVPVAKHGNRRASSTSGAADVLAALGVSLDLPPHALEHRLRHTGCAFLFAPLHHPGLRHASAARSALGTRTIFNLLGPMANPARVRRQLIGVFDPAWARPMAEVLAAHGTERAWFVHGQGLDELTLAGESQVLALEDGVLRAFTVTPEEAGLPRAPIEALRGGDPLANADALRALLDGAPAAYRGAYRDTVLLNAGAALVVAGKVLTLKDGVALAAVSIDGGQARAVLNAHRA